MKEFKGTKGNFTDGTIGWKVNKLGLHYNNPDLEHIEIIWSDDTECVCDTVYKEDDAKLIAAAPELLDALNDLYNSIDSCMDLTPAVLEKSRKAINKALGND